MVSTYINFMSVKIKTDVSRTDKCELGIVTLHLFSGKSDESHGFYFILLYSLALKMRKSTSREDITTSKRHLHRTTLHCTALQYTILKYTALHNKIQCNTLHCTALYYTMLCYAILRYATLHYATMQCNTIYCTTLHCTTTHESTL